MMNGQDIHLDGESIQFDRFDMKQLLYNDKGEFTIPKIAVIAKSGSGKSWVIRDILYYLKGVDSGTVIAPTDRMTKFYDDFFPPLFIHHEYDESIIAKVIARQSKILKKNERRKQAGKKPLDPRTILIMDDCMSSKGSWVKEEPIQELFFNGRHYHISFILTMQYSLGIPPEMRSNFDYIFLLVPIKK